MQLKAGIKGFIVRLITSGALVCCLTFLGCAWESESVAEANKKANSSAKDTRTAPVVESSDSLVLDQSVSKGNGALDQNTASAAIATSTKTETVKSPTTIAAVSDDVAVVSPTPNVTPQLSHYPIEMAQIIELRRQLQQIGPDAGALTDTQVRSLEHFAVHMQNVALSDTELSGDQKKALEDLAGKVQFQANQMRQGRADSTFRNRLAGIKRLLESMQIAIVETDNNAYNR